MNQVEQKVAYTGIKLFIKRIRSKSPALFVKIQWAAGILAALCALIIAAGNAGFLSFLPLQEYNNLIAIAKGLGAGLTGCGIVAALPSTDPNLVSQEVKDAILNQAVQSGTHVPTQPVLAPKQTGDTAGVTLKTIL